jgi:hypothetical protein
MDYKYVNSYVDGRINRDINNNLTVGIDTDTTAIKSVVVPT